MNRQEHARAGKLVNTAGTCKPESKVFHMGKTKFTSNFLWPEMQFECHQVVSPLCVIKFILWEHEWCSLEQQPW